MISQVNRITMGAVMTNSAASNNQEIRCMRISGAKSWLPDEAPESEET